MKNTEIEDVRIKLKASIHKYEELVRKMGVAWKEVVKHCDKLQELKNEQVEENN